MLGNIHHGLIGGPEPLPNHKRVCLRGTPGHSTIHPSMHPSIQDPCTIHSFKHPGIQQCMQLSIHHAPSYYEKEFEVRHKYVLIPWKSHSLFLGFPSSLKKKRWGGIGMLGLTAPGQLWGLKCSKNKN